MADAVTLPYTLSLPFSCRLPACERPGRSALCDFVPWTSRHACSGVLDLAAVDVLLAGRLKTLADTTTFCAAELNR